jgi:DNA-binding CsgD family transcriptional regulator/tetratricopeptide (TPR) repeat protein
VQQAVAALSLATRIDRNVAAAVIGPNADAVLASATEGGFLTTSASGELEMHPLLRRFLQDRLGRDKDLRAGAVRRLGRFLLDEARWDDAFQLIRETQTLDLLDELVTRSLRSLLDEGRLATLESWISFGAQNAHDSPALTVGAAEVALRSGDHRRARVLASQVIRSVPPHSTLLSRAHLIAARASHFTSEEDRAYAELNEAVQTALTLRDRYDAMWLRYICAGELVRPGLQQMLQEFEDLPDGSVDHTIRIESGRTFLRIYHGNVTDQVLDPQTVLELAGRVTDPMVRTAFFQFQTWALTVYARYSDARLLLDAYLDYVNRTRLRFALPHARYLRVAIAIGRRQFGQAQMWLDEMRDLDTDDPYLRGAHALLRSRLLLAQGRFRDAVIFTAATPSLLPNQAPHSEYLAARGVALACSGRTNEALDIVHKIDKLTNTVESAVLVRWVSAIVALRFGDESEVDHAYQFTGERGAYDAFVCAYRAEPRLLHVLYRDLSLRDQLVPILQETGDEDLLPSGAGGGEHASELESLTRREREVLGLLAQGKTNKEIAATLYISEVTAKVHVRHILEKLGVRSRTEAAIIALDKH